MINISKQKQSLENKKNIPNNVSLPPTIERPSPIGFPSSSLSLVISIAVSAPGTISHVAGLTDESSVDEPAPLRLGDATGFFILLAATGG